MDTPDGTPDPGPAPPTPTVPDPLTDPAVLSAARRLVARQAWSQGELSILFHATQDKIYGAIQRNTRRKFFVLCSRRLGKTFMLLALAFQTAIRKPGARVLFLAPTAKQAAQIAVDTAAAILNGGSEPDFACPTDLRPELKAQQKEFIFSNGSIVRLSGVNNEHSADLRGGAADLVILDEAGQMDNLKSVVSDVVMPMTMTTNGQIILATTPPDSPGHDSTQIYEDLAATESAIKFTIRDAPHVTHETKREYLIEAGEKREDVDEILAGKKEPLGTTALREYFCEFVTDASKAVVPEFTPAKQKQLVIEWPRPDFYDSYTAIDPGMEDRTGILFAYTDFLEGKAVIEDEALLHRANTNQIADVIRTKEATNFADHPPYARVSDTDKRLIADLSQLHGLSFAPARDKDPVVEVNLIRNLVQSDKLIINPRCSNLIRQLRNAIWNNTANDFARAGQSSPDGHYDLVAALRYLIRIINWSRNPYPAHYYARGGRFGPGMTDWVSPKTRRVGHSKQLGLHADTPLGRRLAGLNKRRS